MDGRRKSGEGSEEMFARRHAVLTFMFGWAALSLFLATGVAQASEKAPIGYKNDKLFRNGGPVPVLTTGELKLVSETIGTIECDTTAYGLARNQVVGTETRGVGEVQAWNAFNCTSSYIETLEASEKKQLERKEIPCATAGATVGEGKCLTVYVTAELPLEEEEGKPTRRDRAGLPWKSELVAREVEGQREIFLRTGLHAYGEAGALDNYVNETGTCYPTEEKAKGTATPANWSVVPAGCMLLNVVFPQIPTEIVFYGGQEPLMINGTKNGLYPSRLEYGESGKLVSSEGSAGSEAEITGSLYGDGAVTLELITAK